MTAWSQAEAIELCRIVEEVAPDFGCHVALTGGLLYKAGRRKDADLLFYCIRQVDEIDIGGLLTALADLGFDIGPARGWVRKAHFEGKPVDLFFPEAFPASSGSQDDY